MASLDKKLYLPGSVKCSLWWWRKTIHLTMGLLWSYPVNQKLTDASAWGWGAHLAGYWTQGQLSPQQSRASSNWRELKAVHLALLHFQKKLLGGHLLLVLSDDVTAVAYLNKQRGTRS